MFHLDFDVILTNWPFLLDGLELTLIVTVSVAIGGMLLGTIIALARLAPGMAVRAGAAGYVLLFRSMPLVLVLFWFFFLIPLLVGRPIDGLTCALVAFTLFESAYFCEIVRAGIVSVARGQQAAALSLGLRPAQAFAYIILPQAFRNITPILITQVIILFQDTSVLYLVSLHDFMTNASIVANRDGRPIEMYLLAALVYLVICSAGSQIARSALRRRQA